MWTLDALARRSDRDAEGSINSTPCRKNWTRCCCGGGRMPENPDECLLDGHYSGKTAIRATITVLDENSEDTLSALKCKTFTVVGYVSTPLYMDMNRGTTTIGNGSVSAYVYLPRESFDLDYYTEIHVTIPGDYTVYTEAFDDAMDTEAEILEAAAGPHCPGPVVNTSAMTPSSSIRTALRSTSRACRIIMTAKRRKPSWRRPRPSWTRRKLPWKPTKWLLESGKEALSQGQDTLLDSSVTLSQSRQALAEAKAEAYAQITEATKTLYDNYKTVSPESAAGGIRAGAGKCRTGPAEFRHQPAGNGSAATGREHSGAGYLDEGHGHQRAGRSGSAGPGIESGVSADTIASLQQKLDDLKAKQTGVSGQAGRSESPAGRPIPPSWRN